MLITGGSR
jgi:predicted metal-dependent hydrolase